MARMTDAQFAEAEAMAQKLYDFLHDHGEDGDGFMEIWTALDSRFYQKRRAQGDGDAP